MRFIVTGEWSRNSLLRLIMAMFLGFILLFVVTNALLFLERMSFSAESVVAYYLGDPGDEFGRPPRPYGSMVETSHMHMFAMGTLVMVLTHLLLFVPIPVGWKVVLVALAFASALADEAAGWLVRFVHPTFAYLKLGAFALLELSLGGLVLVLFAYLRHPGRNAYRDTDDRVR